MNEYKHLINDYLVDNSTICNRGYYAVSESEIIKILHGLKPSEAPDMYTKIDKKVYILEHFAFDASHEKKGMQGVAEETQLEERIKTNHSDSHWNIEKVKYRISKEDFQRNFERHFEHHYSRIDDYQKNLAGKGVVETDDCVIVGFFIENVYPPYYCNGLRFAGELFYFYTVQFCKYFQQHPNVDFILFGCYCNGRRQLFYIDKASQISQDKQIDLKNPEIQLSHMNSNEVTMYCSIEEHSNDSETNNNI